MCVYARDACVSGYVHDLNKFWTADPRLHMQAPEEIYDLPSVWPPPAPGCPSPGHDETRGPVDPICSEVSIKPPQCGTGKAGSCTPLASTSITTLPAGSMATFVPRVASPNGGHGTPMHQRSIASPVRIGAKGPSRPTSSAPKVKAGGAGSPICTSPPPVGWQALL